MSMQARAFATQIHGKSDDEILKIARISIGIESLLDMTFDTLTNSVNPEADDTTIGFVLTEPKQTHPYAFMIRDGEGVVEKREPSDARVVLTTSVANFFRLLVKELEWAPALQAGTVTATGDLSYLSQIGPLFVQAAPA